MVCISNFSLHFLFFFFFFYSFYVFTQVINKNFDQNQAKDQAQKPTRELSSVVQVVMETSVNTLSKPNNVQI